MECTISDHLVHLQAQLFPVCGKAGLLSSFLQNAIKSNQVEINTDNRSLKQVAKLREPRDLFALPKDLDCPQQAARWPTECQVLDERVQHIEYTPPTPEAYYTPTGKELQPKPVGEEAGFVVYQYYPVSAVNYFSRSSVGGSRYYRPSSTPQNNESEDDLGFESRFESGNLAKVVKITNIYYELYLRTDLYTNRHMQWFYFRITNTRKHLMYRFSIVNLSKPESLYNEGMRPLLYSTKDAKLHSIGWRRCGDNITYFRNETQTEEDEQNPSYTLTFNLEFPHENDTIYIAHCYPYTYTDLQDYLARIQNHPVKSTFCKLRLLCRSLAGNNVYYLTVTAPPTENEAKKKKAVVVTARVHPGETPSSYMMKGLLDFITGDSNPARELREKFIFKIIPMLNPDGVIVGNNRCSLTGRDLNRQYRTVIRETYPPVWHTKLMIRRLIEECGVVMYCDMHAHSRKHNVFIYGCENKRGFDKRLQEQVFPLMLHKNAADKFSFENCKFRIQRSKEGTGRVVVWLMGVANSYTMEASFGGSELGGRANTHFSAQDYEQLGRAFCETLLDFSDEDPSKERLRSKIINRLVKEGSSADEPTNITLSDYSSDEGDTSSSSDDEGQITKRDGECCPLLVPPPSPVLPHKHHKTKKSGKKSLKPIRKEKSYQKKTLQIVRATLDLPTTDPGSDLCEVTTDAESGCEGCHDRGDEEYSPGRLCYRRHIRNRAKHKGKRHMPPELIVTPAQVFDASDNEKERETKETQTHSPSESLLLEFPPVEKIRTKTWHHFKSLPAHKALTDKTTRVANVSDLQVKLTSVRKQIWTGTGDWGIGVPLSWGLSQMIDFHGDSEALLKSCSQKLTALQKNSISKDMKVVQDSKSIKKKISFKTSEKIKTLNVENHSDEVESNRNFARKKIRLKRSKTSTEKTELPKPENSSLLYVWHKGHRRKSFNAQMTMPPSPSPLPIRNKFKTGGIVATAVQSQKYRRPIVKSEESNSDSESEDTLTQKNKKKKKKRKNNSNKSKRVQSVK